MLRFSPTNLMIDSDKCASIQCKPVASAMRDTGSARVRMPSSHSMAEDLTRRLSMLVYIFVDLVTTMQWCLSWLCYRPGGQCSEPTMCGSSLTTWLRVMVQIAKNVHSCDCHHISWLCDGWPVQHTCTLVRAHALQCTAHRSAAPVHSQWPLHYG
jgi:hypothetical protein